MLILASLSLCGCGLLTKDADKGAAAADAANSQEEEQWTTDPVPYKVSIKVLKGPDSLEGKMKGVSQLVALEKEAPDSLLALERRARQDQETAIRLLHSQCYYEGEAKIDINSGVKPARVTLTLIPGPLFTLGHAWVHYDPEPLIPEYFRHRTREAGFWGLSTESLPPPEFPDSVPGVEPGKPIVADAMLAAVEEIPSRLKATGYPLARLAKSVYTLNRAAKLLNADITIDPGPPALLGEVMPRGNRNVNSEFLRRLAPWTPGKEVWDDNLANDYANELRGLGLFRSVEIKPAVADLKTDEAGKRGGAAILPLDVDVIEGPQRSISASARYDTDSGFGVEGTWEHRNLFNNGEKLVLDAPISEQESGIKAHFEKPAFLTRDQKLLANASALWENTDAYQQQSMKGDLGIERRLAPRWWGGLSIFAEGGYLKDNEHERQAYAVLSPRAGLRYDGRNNRLNPTSGMEMELKLKPFSGYYEESFGAFAGSLMLAAFYAPLGRKNDGRINDKIVLAARGEAGAMPGASSLRSIPASLRYYTGGAGSVRGYSYQAIGPRDNEGDPLGGRSYQVVNLEARFMVAENIGIVPFLDGGMVYRDEFPRIFGDMDWGTGLGLRYYTPIGPVRLDVATPLTRIDDDPPVQVYLSIGQSF